MERTARLLVSVLMTVALLAVGAGPAVAEPGKNQIEAETSSCSNGQNYAFVINGMGKAWQIQGSNGNLIVKGYTLSYFDPDSGEFIGSDTYGGGKKNGQQGRLISCVGETTTDLIGLGTVRVVAEFDAFVTPGATP
jgi:hypothetical protein